ncbi:MAG: hypothetical protein LBE06_01560, partial [Azoarcus sp.]|nr:hypothetical protein [Azoarcus sp.]
MNRNFRLTAVALALASLFPPAQAEERPVRMEDSLLDWARANATTSARPATRRQAIPPAAFPWDAEKILSSVLPEVLVAEESGRADKAALEAALKKWAARQDPLDRKALTDFLATHPQSAWKPALLGNLGLLALEEGRFTQAIADLEAAWNAGKAIQHPGVKALVDHLGGALLTLRMQLGHGDAAAALLSELEKRPLIGAASEARARGREHPWRLRSGEGAAFLCGPLALARLRGAPLDPGTLPAHKRGGYSLLELAELAQGQAQPLIALHREAGAKVPVPSVIHWKSGHYAALLERQEGEEGARYRIHDAALGRDYWIGQAALEEEASGYFLAEEARLAGQAGWRAATREEGATVIGAGGWTLTEPDDLPPCDPADCTCKKTGMAGVSVQPLKVSLLLTDTPLAYRPPKGPAVPLSVHYNHRASAQPATYTYSNLGPNWSWRGIAYIADNPNYLGSDYADQTYRYMAGGGIRLQKAYDAASGAFARDRIDQSRLVLVSADPIVYERHLADGGKEIYSSIARTYYNHHYVMATARRVFLTKAFDAAGNALTYHYDEQDRLSHLTDAGGGVTRVEYTHADPLKITALIDPAGRRATFGYDDLGRLARITDAAGLVSAFTYRDKSAFIEKLTTPYGASLFDFAEGYLSKDNHYVRWLELTDAKGQKERVEYAYYVPEIGYSLPAAEVPVGMPMVHNSSLNLGSTYHWDAVALAQYPGDYTKAEIRQWHYNFKISALTHELRSSKRPLESHLWYSYPGQTQYNAPGVCDKPAQIGRVLPDGSTQLTQYTYNDWGNPTQHIDPVGRETKYDYAENGIDLIKVQQKTAKGWDTLTQITWNNQHRPLTVRDAAGRITKYTYN